MAVGVAQDRQREELLSNAIASGRLRGNISDPVDTRCILPMV